MWAINAYGTSAPSDASASFTPVQPQVGLFMGGSTGSNSDVIDKIDLVSTGNASDFGNLLTANFYLSKGGASSGVRGVVGGGDSNSNVMQYVTIATAGNATDFGDLSHTAVQGAWCSSATRGVHAGGGEIDIEYITIDTTGNTTDFGDLVRESQEMGGASSTTRGVFASLHAGSGNDIGYITIASTGNDTDFGDLLSSITNGNPAGGSNNTRGIFAGGPVGLCN